MTLDFDHLPRRGSMTALDRAAQAIGLFSIALGVAELAFPGAVGRAVGLEGRQGLLRASGLRSIAAGVGALQPNPGPAIWSRAAGDLLDLAALALARGPDESKRRTATTTMIAVGAITLVDLLVAAGFSHQAARRPSDTRDYSDRVGFPNGLEAARGAAANSTPRDFRVSARPDGGSETRPM